MPLRVAGHVVRRIQRCVQRGVHDHLCRDEPWYVQADHCRVQQNTKRRDHKLGGLFSYAPPSVRWQPFSGLTKPAFRH